VNQTKTNEHWSSWMDDESDGQPLSRMVAELGLGDLAPLIDAIPELAAAKVAAQVAAAG
jgi:hypothetical protein